MEKQGKRPGKLPNDQEAATTKVQCQQDMKTQNLPQQ
jgi:hypothetical protein